jgi:hypothetical protein
VNSCFAATAGEGSAEKARKAFIAFWRKIGLLAKDSAGPGIAGRMGRFLKPLAK